jgi:hypothetical protein
MTPEDKAEFQAMMLETMGGLVQGLQRHLDQQILELQADVDVALDKLDSLAIDVKDTRVQVTKLSRERFRDVRRDELSRERELSNLTEIEALKFRVSKLEKGSS